MARLLPMEQTGTGHIRQSEIIMDISTIERTILEKCAKDAGWKIDSNSKSDSINLFSSFFKETGTIRKNSDSSFVIRFSTTLSKSHFDSDLHFNSNGEFEFKLQESFFFSELLKRIAELFASLPDNPLDQYQKKLAEFSDIEIQKTEAEGVAFMSDKPITRMVNHPYVKSSPETHSHFRNIEQYPLYHKNP